ncbi:MAG: hypothetical protein RR555_08290 [Bacteroidales bacterium]
MEKLEFSSIKDSEILSNELMNEIEGAECTSCSQSCRKKKSTTNNGNDGNGGNGSDIDIPIDIEIPEL